MNDRKKRTSTGRRSSQLGRKDNNTFVTKSGKTIKINNSLSQKIKARKEEYARKRAIRLAGMPKSRVKRFFYRLHPKRLYKYWFSREGGIMAVKITGVAIVFVFLTVVGVFAYFRKDLPNLRDISGNNIGGSVQYYDRTGQTLLWEDYDAVKRVPVAEEAISEHLKNATIAIEDREFFSHNGFDVKGIARASINNFTGSGEIRQGGSTITQQLVRLTQDEVGREQTYQRKIKELILSIELERSFSKQEILTGYLNTAPYGNIQYGVEAATQDYFDKSAKEVTLDEAAFLAAIPQSPSFYSPYGPIYEPEALIGRQHYILDLMEEYGMITSEERDEAKQVEILAKVQQVRPKFDGVTAPWFVLSAKEQLEREHPQSERAGWKITTSLDIGLQQLAEAEIEKGMTQVIRQGGNVAALVAEDVKTGEVVALVGGPDFGSDTTFAQNNYARELLPPGSTIKPYSYAAMIETTENTGAGSVLYDTQGPIDGYPCTNRSRPGNPDANCLWNFDFRHPGPMTLRYALGGSRNIPAVKAMLTAGVDKTIELTNGLMGVTSSNGYRCFLDDGLSQQGPCFASSGIGDGAYLRLDDHVHGYASLSRNGLEVPKTYILSISDSTGDEIAVPSLANRDGTQVIRPDAAYIVNDMLSDPNASYFSAARKPHRYTNAQGTWKFAMKTGTTNDAKDAWMLGYSSKYSVGVWAGSDKRQVTMSGSMENMTQPIWQSWMREAHKDLAPEDWAVPEGVQTLPAFVVRTHVGIGSVEPSPTSDIFPSWYQKRTNGNARRTIDVVSNKLATDCTPNRARNTVNEGSANQFSSDKFVDGGPGSNTNEQDDVHKCEDIRPAIRLITTPTGNSFRLEADVTQGTHPISSERFQGTVNFIVDGTIVRAVSVNGPGTVGIDYTPDGPGTKQVVTEVIDSVLYDASDTSSITVAAAPAPTAAIVLTANRPGNGNVQFTWTGGKGPFEVLRSDGREVCNTSSRSCTAALEAGQTVYVRDDEDRESNRVTVQ